MGTPAVRFAPVLFLLLFVAACGGGGATAPALPGGGPGGGAPSGAPSLVFDSLLAAAEGVPAGAQPTFVGDAVTLRGSGFTTSTKVFFGLDVELAHAENSLLTTPVDALPPTPFRHVDPVTSQATILEVEAPVAFLAPDAIRVTIPAAVACHVGFTNPFVRVVDAGGSSAPQSDVLFVVGPRFIGLTPDRGLDAGGYAVAVHGDFFSPYTQVAVRFTDPATGDVRTIGDTPATDVVEHFVNRNTLLVPAWPAAAAASAGLTRELHADVLLFESIDAIDGSSVHEPELGGVAPCAALEPESPVVPLVRRGARNAERAGAFTFLPGGVSGFPEIFGMVPSSGPEIGGNTVVLRGDQFDAFTADLSDPDDPGVGVECPPGSGRFLPALSAVLVDRRTLVVRMPACSVDAPAKAAICLRNRFSVDNPGVRPSAGASDDCVVFPEVYTYLPVSPVEPPRASAAFADAPSRALRDAGFGRLFLLGDRFDETSAGAVALRLPGGERVPALGALLHARDLLEVFVPRLPAGVYPLSADLAVDLVVANAAGETTLSGFVTIVATPDAGAPPTLARLLEASGPVGGANRIVVLGANFDTTTTVRFGATDATDVHFVDANTLLATVPAATAPGTVAVTVVDDGVASAPLPYVYSATAGARAPVIAALSDAAGAAGGGYALLVRGVHFQPSARVLFGGHPSPEVRFLSDTLLRAAVPGALPDEVGTTVPVEVTDPARGFPAPLHLVPFTYEVAAPEIAALATNVEGGAALPAVQTPGGDAILVQGAGFGADVAFRVAQGGVETPADAASLAPGVASLRAPPGAAGFGNLTAHAVAGSSDPAAIEYVTPAAPRIADARNLAEAGRAAPVDGGSRVVLFGERFFPPLAVRLTGCDASDPALETTVTVAPAEVTRVDDQLLGIPIPAGVFCEGPLTLEVETPFGVAAFEASAAGPFLLVGPRAPAVDGVFPTVFASRGGEEAVFVGRGFTETTRFRVGTEGMSVAAFRAVLSARVVSDSVAVVTMPALPGGLPPAGIAGFVHAEETDPGRVAAIEGEPFTTSGALFRVVREGLAALLAVVPDHGFVEGGETVLLLGNGFLDAFGGANVTDVRFVDALLGDVGDYVAASPTDLPLDASDRGRYFVLNDQQILLVTNPRPPIPNDLPAPVDVVVESFAGRTSLAGGFTYLNSPAVRTPFLLAITPNEARVNGGSTHLLSGAFLTSADRIVFVRPGDGASLALDFESEAFAQVTDAFLVLTLPDLRGTFRENDLLDVRAEKDLPGGDLRVSNTLRAALRLTFAGPPRVDAALNPSAGGAFGGTVVEIAGDLFTTNSQVLFGTMPARNVVFVSPTRLFAIAPTLPVDLPDPGLDLRNVHEAPPTVDVAVFTQGGWAVLESAFTFEPEAPAVLGCAPDVLPERAAARITVSGLRFVPGSTTVAAELGDVANVVVEDFATLRFDYVAPGFPRGTLGPRTERFFVATNQGDAPEPCAITIKLDPFVDGCTTNYALNDHDAPTTGVHAGAFVVGTVTGGNFEPGGGVTLFARTGAPIALVEVPPGTELAAPGRFRVDDARTIRFTPPYRFPSATPTIIDGNPNVGPVALAYTSLESRTDTLEDAFAYVPSVMDFDDVSFGIPNTSGDVSFPDRVTTGDVNGDGLPDVVAIARQTSPSSDTRNAEAYVFLADTFGPLDVNEDGRVPDFAGRFTRFVISDDALQTRLEKDGRGGRPLLVNLDGDRQLEIVVPVEGGLLLVDVTSAGALGAQTVVRPAALGATGRISGLAAGNFRGDDGADLALFASGKIVVLASTATPFVFAEIVTSAASGLATPEVSYLEAGDFDGDGDDDLAWGLTKGSSGGSGSRSALPIVVARVEDGAVVAQQAIANLTGGRVGTIVAADADGDGRDDLFVLVQDEAAGALLGTTRPGGIAVVLDPFDLAADAYYETAFRRNTSAPYEGSGVYLALADVNADGHADLAAASEDGEFQVFVADGAGGFSDAGRSWALASRTSDFRSVLHGLAGADMNHDGMAELFVGDVGVSPTALVLWLNVSR